MRRRRSKSLPLPTRVLLYPLSDDDDDEPSGLPLFPAYEQRRDSTSATKRKRDDTDERTDDDSLRQKRKCQWDAGKESQEQNNDHEEGSSDPPVVTILDLITALWEDDEEDHLTVGSPNSSGCVTSSACNTGLANIPSYTNSVHPSPYVFDPSTMSLPKAPQGDPLDLEVPSSFDPLVDQEIPPAIALPEARASAGLPIDPPAPPATHLPEGYFPVDPLPDPATPLVPFLPEGYSSSDLPIDPGLLPAPSPEGSPTTDSLIRPPTPLASFLPAQLSSTDIPIDPALLTPPLPGGSSSTNIPIDTVSNTSSIPQGPRFTDPLVASATLLAPFLPEDSSSADIPIDPALLTGPLPEDCSTSAELPVDSTTPEAIPEPEPGPEPEPEPTDGHAELLATKWLDARKLSELVEKEGLVYKKGKFSATEEKQVVEAMKEYGKTVGISDEQVQAIIFPKDEKCKNKDFWAFITRAVPLRPVSAVYQYVRRKFHPMRGLGPWKQSEDEALRKAVTKFGQRWEVVASHVGRRSVDCRDRYRNHIVEMDTRKSGAWSEDEEEELTRIVTEMTSKQGRDINDDIFWTTVSKSMGGRRGRQQCRTKWMDTLNNRVKAGGVTRKWGPEDAAIFLQKLEVLDVNDDTEINWKYISTSDPEWSFWSPHMLQRRWVTLKKGVKGYHEAMAHREIMDLLRTREHFKQPGANVASSSQPEPAPASLPAPELPPAPASPPPRPLPTRTKRLRDTLPNYVRIRSKT